MLNNSLKIYASDVILAAQRLAHIKSDNAFPYQDCVTYLNDAWQDIYGRLENIDSGFFSKVVRLTHVTTRLPANLRNVVCVFTATQLVGANRNVLRTSGTGDIAAPGTYHISGNELYVPDVRRRTTWLEYVPNCPYIFYTLYNRNPIVKDETRPVYKTAYGVYTLTCYVGDASIEFNGDDVRERLSRTSKIVLHHNSGNARFNRDITHLVKCYEDSPEEGSWQLCYISCDYPYIFITLVNDLSNEYRCFFLNASGEHTDYRPFAYNGRPGSLEYIETGWNDNNGLGVTVLDHSTNSYLQLGWTPDTLISYPAPEVSRLLIAKLAARFAALNESELTSTQMELAAATYSFEAYADKNKAGAKRIENVNPATIADFL